MRTCYIVGAGDFAGGFCPDATDLVIAADGGFLHLLENKIRCDLFIGDADSLGYIPEGIESIIHPIKKNETDMQLA